MNTVRIAVVGLHHGIEHVQAIVKNPQMRLVGICDRSQEQMDKAKDVIRHAIGSEPAGITLFDDYNQLLEWGEFDAVVIATPPVTHKEMAIRAIQANKHVLLEKPLTPTLDEAREIIAVHQKAKTVFQVGHEVRSSQLIRRLLDLIHAGKIGEVVFVWWHMFEHVDYSQLPAWQSNRKIGGGILFDCGCHYWDILQLLAGARFHRLSAFGHAQGRIGPNPDTLPHVTTVNFEYANGVRGNLSISDISPTPECSLFGVVGTNGIVYGNPWRPEEAGSLDCYTEGGLYREQIAINGQMASRGHLGFMEQHVAFADAILEKKPVVCSLQDAFEVAVISIAINQSLSTGNTVLRSSIIK